MPKVSKRRSHSRAVNAGLNRMRNQNVQETTSSETSESEDEELKLSEEIDEISLNFKDKLNDISDLFEFCRKKFNLKYLSVLLYMSLRYFGVTWRDCDSFLQEIGSLRSRTCQKWVDVLSSGDFNEFCSENRGGKHTEEFYDLFPEIELEAKCFAIERCAKKSADFTSLDLAVFIDQKYYKLTNTIKDNSNKLIRSVKACRLDLRRWGARFDANSQRPYFEGHERTDVVLNREKFINYFLDRFDYYYTVSDGEIPSWNIPTKSLPSILICK